ncbi:MAG: hypothetical protein K2W95_26735 [Candidatus Obscuribacterales bacterium]|nr:hypothetical protein [Candidatus Obscuribacterales bacterium]
MNQSVIHTVFADTDNARTALEELTVAGVQPGSISVIGEDSDAFRHATAPLYSRKVDRLLYIMGAIGGIAGAAAGFLGMPAIPGDSHSYLIASVAATGTGLALGAYAGTWMAGILNLDNFPGSDSKFRFGKPQAGKVAISISTANILEAERVRRLLREYSTNKICIESV